MTTDRPMTDREYDAIVKLTWQHARQEPINDDDNSDSWTDRVHPDAFSEALDVAEDTSAADISDVVWGTLSEAYSQLWRETFYPEV